MLYNGFTHYTGRAGAALPTCLGREVQQMEEYRVLLVDDVVTSGATLSECAALLRMGGAVQVWCLTLARARGDR